MQVCCEMETILKIANRYNIAVVEDSAQGMMATYKNKALGTIGDIGTYSIPRTKGPYNRVGRGKVGK